jgi:hypothetical protein
MTPIFFMLVRFYVWVVELFTVWYEKSDASETAGLPEPFISEKEASSFELFCAGLRIGFGARLKAARAESSC